MCPTALTRQPEDEELPVNPPLAWAEAAPPYFRLKEPRLVF